MKPPTDGHFMTEIFCDDCVCIKETFGTLHSIHWKQAFVLLVLLLVLVLSRRSPGYSEEGSKTSARISGSQAD